MSVVDLYDTGDIRRRMAEIKLMRAALKREYKSLQAKTLTIRFTEGEVRSIKRRMYEQDELYGQGDEVQLLMDMLHGFLDLGGHFKTVVGQKKAAKRTPPESMHSFHAHETNDGNWCVLMENGGGAQNLIEGYSEEYARWIAETLNRELI